MKEFHIDGYEPLFEIGLYEGDSPCCRVLNQDTTICPITLAALVLALFETTMNGVPENEQIDFEQKFHKAFKIMLEERFDYNLITKYPEDE